MRHVSWPTLAKKFDYSVHWVVWSHFQQLIVKVRSRSGQKRSNFQFHKCQQKRYLSDAVLPQKSDDALYFVMRRPEHVKMCIWIISSFPYPIPIQKNEMWYKYAIFYISGWNFQYRFTLMASQTYIPVFYHKPKMFEKSKIFCFRKFGKYILCFSFFKI